MGGWGGRACGARRGCGAWMSWLESFLVGFFFGMMAVKFVVQKLER